MRGLHGGAPISTGSGTEPDVVRPPVRRVNIGLDYGTSSTKICVREQGRDFCQLLTFGAAPSGYPDYCLPSTICVEQGKLYFGTTAERRRGRKLRSLKVCLLCQHRVIPCRGCEPSAKSSNLDPGVFNLSKTDGLETYFTAEELCTLYLASVFTMIGNQLRARRQVDSSTKILTNGAAPLDHVSLAPIRDSFERVLFLAKELGGRVYDGLSLEEARRLLNEMNEQFPSTPPEEDRTAFLIQETIGGLHAHCCEASTPPGLYAVVDIGAGTTNVTFFRLGSGAGLRRTFAYYSSQTGIVGGDDIDRAILSRIRTASSLPRESSEAYREMLQRIRLGKQNLGLNDLELADGVQITNADVRSAIEEVGERIYEVYRSAFKRAYLKEMRGDRWLEYTVILIGGGSWVHGIEEIFYRKPHNIVERINVIRPKRPKRMTDFNGTALKLSVSDYSLINLSYGLSTERPNIPDYFAPDQVEPLPLPPPPVERDVEDLYPK